MARGTAKPAPRRGAKTGKALAAISRELSERVGALRFAEPVAYVYNPVDYAWKLHESYLRRYGDGPKEVLLLGMNPGPWGMVQTGVPFGETSIVREWLGLSGTVGKPAPEHPKRQVLGLSCPRSEVSGARLWGWARERFGSAEDFFARFFVTNYCPLAFLEASGKNRTPDKLPAAERDPLTAACDDALRATVEVLRPERVIGVGAYAETQAKKVLSDMGVTIGRVLHPSPASPIANRGWAAAAEKDFAAMGVSLPSL